MRGGESRDRGILEDAENSLQRREHPQGSNSRKGSRGALNLDPLGGGGGVGLQKQRGEGSGVEVEVYASS